jgi:hypothetical protein
VSLTTSKENIRLAVINAISFVVLAVFVEGLIFLCLIHPAFVPGFLLPAFREYYQTADRNIIQVTECGRYDSTLFYTLRPGSCTFSNREFEVVCSVNSVGVRDDEKSLQAPAIITLGDSYTMGWGVSQDESFPQLLEASLGIKVLNAGMSSFGTARELTLLKRFSLDSVKYLLIQYHANDYEENKAFLNNGNVLRVRSRQSYDSLCEAIRERQRYFPFKHLYGISKGVARNIINDDKSPATKPSEEARDFLRVVQQARINPHIRIIIFKLEHQNKLNNKFALAIDSLLQTDEYRSLNMQTVKLAALLSEEDYFLLDDHINRYGHYKIAEKIREQMIID